MFTGIVQDVGEVLALTPRGGDLRITVRVGHVDLSGTAQGDSIAVAGVCLTVIERSARDFSADVSRETLAHTSMGRWQAGRRVNLEPALRAGDALGGHLMQGHVDGVADLLGRHGDARSQRMWLRAPHALAHYIARKGSVALDGVSLTVNSVDGDCFDVNLVPHTLAVTTFGDLVAGAQLNLEIDPIARYVERLLHASPDGGN